jgi:hypothetical protein
MNRFKQWLAGHSLGGLNMTPLGSVMVLLFALAVLMFFYFPPKTTPEIELNNLPWNHEQFAAIRDVAGRILWCFAALLQTVVLLFAIACFSKILRRTLTRRALLLVIGVCALILASVVLFGQNIGFYFSQLPAQLLKRSLEKRHNSVLGYLIDFHNGLAFILAIAGLLAIGCCAAQPNGEPIRSFKNRKDEMRFLLLVSMIALIAGLVQVHFEYRWVASLFRDKSDSEKLWELGVELCNSITIGAGCLFSAVLLAAFVPGFYMLQVQFEFSYGTTLKTKPFQISWKEIATDVLKIAGPVLTAWPLASLFKT